MRPSRTGHAAKYFAPLAGFAMLAACSADTPAVVGSQPPTTSRAESGTGAPRVDTVDVVVDGLRAPWGVAFLPDGSAVVTERDSRRVLRIARGPGHDSAYGVSELAVIEEADSGGEGGLLGIAASPGYATDATLFLYYTTADDNRIARWKIGERPQPIVTGIPISGIHNGGRLAFGPDGYLYATTGDAGTGGIAQDLGSLGGKILRMTADGKPAPGNPFDSLIWTYGHRNVQGIAWDSRGQLWATEFGASDWDEINLIEPGENYGWPEAEGAVGDPRFKDPIVAWETSESSCSGAAILNDVLVAACLRGQRLWLMQTLPDGMIDGAPVPQLVREYGRLRDVVVGPDRTLWVLTNNHDGRCRTGCTIHPDDDRILGITLGNTLTSPSGGA